MLPALLVAGALAGTWFGATLVAGQRYVVAAGDTLWSIALRLDPAGDPRPLVDALAAQVQGGSLQPGQVLVLP